MTIKLPRLGTVALTDKDGKSTRELSRFWDQAMSSIEDSFNQLADAVDAIATAQAAAVTAQAAAVAAQASADDAAAAAGGGSSLTSLQLSRTIGCVIHGHDAGSNGDITISAHTRHYGDGTEVAVNSGTLLSLAYSTAYWIYYDQSSRLGGAVTYHAVLFASIGDSQPSDVFPDRHFVGSCTTPAALDPTTDGEPNEL